MTISKPKRPESRVGGIVALLFGFAFVGVIGSCLITIGIWPGQIKLVAPVFCTDAQPDAFVVADTYSPRPGETVTDFTLYCMGERGDSTDHGFMLPFLLVSVINGVVICAFLWLIARLLRPRGPTHPAVDGTEASSEPPPIGAPSSPPSGSTAGPFVN